MVLVDLDRAHILCDLEMEAVVELLCWRLTEGLVSTRVRFHALRCVLRGDEADEIEQSAVELSLAAHQAQDLVRVGLKLLLSFI